MPDQLTPGQVRGKMARGQQVTREEATLVREYYADYSKRTTKVLWASVEEKIAIHGELKQEGHTNISQGIREIVLARNEMDSEDARTIANLRSQIQQDQLVYDSQNERMARLNQELNEIRRSRDRAAELIAVMSVVLGRPEVERHLSDEDRRGIRSLRGQLA